MYEYEIGDSGVAITGYSGSESEITIPSHIEGFPVTSIGFSAFRGSELTNVIIPDGVTSIKQQAFFANHIINITIPDSVTHIGLEAFGCNQLKSATIGSGVTYIGQFAFADNFLTNLTISNSASIDIGIWDNAFENNLLTHICIPENVTFIGWNTFRNNPLANVIIGDIKIPLDLEETKWIEYYKEQLEEKRISELTAAIGAAIGHWELLD